MKKIFHAKITLLTLSLGLTAAAPAFAAEAGKASFGVLGAVTLQNPSFNDNGSSQDVDGKLGYGGGLSVELPITDALGWETDLLYLNHKFSRDTAEFFGSNVSSTVSAGYLHVPVLLRYHVLPILSVAAGGYYSRVINKWTVAAEGFGDATADYSKNDFGFVVGAGVDIPLGGAALTVDARYARSLTDNARDSNDALKFAEIQALAGVKFAF